MNTPPMQVVFGSGPLGLSVMRALVRRGCPVRMVNRSGKLPDGLPAGVEVLAGDAYQPDFTRRACKDAVVVYQCSQPAYHEWIEKFPPLQASILVGAAAAGARFIVAENLYMYGEVDGPIREDLPYAATTRKGKVRSEMSQALLAAHRSGKVSLAMGRGSDFFGPYVLTSALGERAIPAALQGKSAQLAGNLDVPHSFTYIDDFGEALATLGEREEALGQAWHVPNPAALTQRQTMTLFFDAIGKPAKISTATRMMMRIAGLFDPGARETVEMMYEFEKPFVVDSTKFERTFAKTATPFKESIPPTLDWFRKRSGQQVQR
jgi:nucleoside-diphosphate-sugar epimerase